MTNHPRTVCFSIKALSNQIKRHIDCIYTKDSGTALTGMQLGVIGYVHEHVAERDIFQKDIENEFNIRRSTATGILQLMEKNGLLSREAVSHDARLKKIILTGKAKEICRTTKQEIMSLEKRITYGLTGEELNTFFCVIDKMTKNIE